MHSNQVTCTYPAANSDEASTPKDLSPIQIRISRNKGSQGSKDRRQRQHSQASRMRNMQATDADCTILMLKTHAPFEDRHWKHIFSGFDLDSKRVNLQLFRAPVKGIARKKN